MIKATLKTMKKRSTFKQPGYWVEIQGDHKLNLLYIAASGKEDRNRSNIE